MQVNISSLKDSVVKFDKDIKSFEEASFNLYQNIEAMGTYWKTSITEAFFSSFEEEKAVTKDMIANMKKFKNIHQYIIDSLEKYGKKIDVDLDLRDKVLSSFDTYAKEENKIIDIYNTIDMSYFTNETNDLKKDKALVIDSKNKINKLEDAFKNMFDRIEEVEYGVDAKLNSINILQINDINFNTLEKNTIKGEVGIKKEIKTLLEGKVKYYVEEQISYFEDIKKDFISLGYAYISELNGKKIETIENDIALEFSKASSNHQNMLEFVLNELNKVVAVERELTKSVTSSINTEN